MPYPAQIDYETLIETASAMIEDVGVEGTQLRLLAEKIGVKAPSLYNHVANKGALLRAVNELTLKRFVDALYQAADSENSVEEKLIAIAHRFRSFAHENPVCYSLANNSPAGEERPDPQWREALILPLQALVAELVGEDNAFPALRGIYAFLHGWVMLEISQQFERGGDLDAHFLQSFQALLAGWQ